MRIIGTTRAGEAAFDEPLGHGEDPEVLAHRHGFGVRRPLGAERVGEDLLLRLEVQQAARPAPRRRTRGRDSGLVVDPDTPVVRRQRVAAYAVVRSSAAELLATEFSDRTAVPGRWGLPGGGVDPGEQPRITVLREVAEETSQAVQLGDLVRVQTSHWVGTSPRGVVEDFHAIRLVYLADCPEPSEPVVRDVGGTTRSTRWVPLADWAQLSWTVGWREVLTGLLRP